MYSEANASVQSLLEDLVASGEEIGLQVAAYLNGKLVIDTWAGLADAATGRPVDGDTLFNVFSTTKGITSACIHMLAERGKLDYDDPVARYWPAFGARGKEGVTLRQVLSHTAGVPLMPEDTSTEMMCDWDRMCAAIADLPLEWEPGKGHGYHGLTMGWILGEVLRRVDGRPIGQFVQEEVCRPLGLRNLFIGIPEGVEDRIAPLVQAPPPEGAPAPTPLTQKRAPSPVSPADTYNRPGVRRAAIPAANGIMSARDLARFYAGISTGADGVRLLSPARVSMMYQPHTDGMWDQTQGRYIRRGLGYILAGPDGEQMGPSPVAFGHAGLGGSIGYADPRSGLAIGFVKNRLVATVDPTAMASYRVATRIRKALGVD